MLSIFKYIQVQYFKRMTYFNKEKIVQWISCSLNNRILYVWVDNTGPVQEGLLLLLTGTF